MYAIYDQKLSGQIVGTFDTYKQAGEFLGLSPDAVQKAIKRSSTMKKQYTAEKIEFTKEG